MKTRTSHKINAALSVILSSMFAQGIITSNYVVSVIVLVFGITLMAMLGLRAHQIPDEREKAIAGSASFITLCIFSTVSVFTAFWLLVLKGDDTLFRMAAFVLAYSASFTMLCFGIMYSVLNASVSKAKRVGYVIFVLAIALFFIVYGIHTF
jgi:uncharacterized membrane protein